MVQANSPQYVLLRGGQEERQANKQLPIAISHMNMVDLPLEATSECARGTTKKERAPSEGIKAWVPELLAKPNRGILYVLVSSAASR